MRYINIETWPRREHFQLFNGWSSPHFSLCANVNISAFYKIVKKQGFSLSTAIAYLLARVANAIPEFRYRIREGQVVEHEIVHPSTTIPTGKDLFSFCTLEYMTEFSLFTENAKERIAYVKSHPTVEDEPGQDNLLFMTAIPWVSFTSFSHPLDLNPVDSIPRFAWGKLFEDGETLKMPLNVQVHHALMDGIHVGKFYEEVQRCLDRPELILGKE